MGRAYAHGIDIGGFKTPRNALLHEPLALRIASCCDRGVERPSGYHPEAGRAALTTLSKEPRHE
jgi:hypothetical protein